MSEEKPQQDLEALAALIGSTNAELKKIDGEIVSSSANLQASSESWNPQGILKDHIVKSGAPPAQPQATPPPPSDPAMTIPPAGIHPETLQHQPQPQPQLQPVYAPAPITPAPTVNVVTREFEERLKIIEDKMDMLIDYMRSAEKLDKKISSFVDRGLKERVKQVTIKLDDSQDK